MDEVTTMRPRPEFTQGWRCRLDDVHHALDIDVEDEVNLVVVKIGETGLGGTHQR